MSYLDLDYLLNLAYKYYYLNSDKCFLIENIELDDINNKMWYHLNDSRYYGNDGTIYCI